MNPKTKNHWFWAMKKHAYPSLWLVFRTRHGSQIWCMLTQITKTRWEPGKKNPIAPLPRSSSLLTLPQGSLATPQFVGPAPTTRGMMPKSWLNHTSDYDSNAIVVIFFEKSKKKLEILELNRRFWWFKPHPNPLSRCLVFWKQPRLALPRGLI